MSWLWLRLCTLSRLRWESSEWPKNAARLRHGAVSRCSGPGTRRVRSVSGVTQCHVELVTMSRWLVTLRAYCVRLIASGQPQARPGQQRGLVNPRPRVWPSPSLEHGQSSHISLLCETDEWSEIKAISIFPGCKCYVICWLNWLDSVCTHRTVLSPPGVNGSLIINVHGYTLGALNHRRHPWKYLNQNTY